MQHRPGGIWFEMRSLFRDILFAGLVAVLIVVFVDPAGERGGAEHDAQAPRSGPNLRQQVHLSAP
jgi:hypothetical protein